ncbi:metallophosphoesterase family protein [Anaeromyxobacter oryzae]|uniref:metallophosphoesterase n=1 Tax=Anaeromyxobacter oryzae TaxID=2918170 RepID=UPI0020C0BDA4|nr:metallophosphoesterase [Anaeromyxobacter oryzae]
MTGAGRERPRDLVVVSDLHLGRGKNPRLKRWYRLEAFFYDDDFHAFCEWLCRDAATRGLRFALVLNGDSLDLLRIEPEPAPGGGALERRFGPTVTPAVAARMVRDILGGHPAFADALAVVLAAGHEVIFLPGNHDLEVQWAPVQDTLRGAIAERLAARGAPSDALARLGFEPWFLYEPGRIWIEHGCQYDPEGAFRFPLRRRLGDSPGAEALIARDVPFGNFFQKYLYNGFGPINFIVPSSRANYRYFRFLLANRPRLLFSVARSHGPFLVQLLRRLARAPASGWHREAEQGHAEELAELAARTGVGTRLQEIDALKSSGADAARVTSGMLRQTMKLAAGGALVTLAAMFVWAAAWRAVDSLIMGFGWKALVSLALYVVFGAIGVAALVAAALRTQSEEPPPSLEAAAERIANIAEVPLVVFGHTHDEGVDRLRASGDAWYFNTGTWIALFSDDLLLPRERVQYTFLRVSGRDAELLQWSPGRGRPIPVVLLEGNGG